MGKKAKLKLLNLTEIRRLAWERERPAVVNKTLEKQLKTIVDHLIKKESRKEALKIILSSSKENIGQFLYYYYSDNCNVACMVLDVAKNELVKHKKMKQNKKDSFGTKIVKV